MGMTTDVPTYLSQGCGRCELAATPDCKVHQWSQELIVLREIISKCGLVETVKWGVPCYTLEGKNILLLSAFKTSCTLSFFKGSLLRDDHDLLIAPGQNSQATRMLKFEDVQSILEHEEPIRNYIEEAIEVERAGKQVVFKKAPELMPSELIKMLEEDPLLKTAFEALTPGRQRGYIIHFSQPKQSQTRINRIDKWTPMILNGKGMHDDYRRAKKKAP